MRTLSVIGMLGACTANEAFNAELEALVSITGKGITSMLKQLTCKDTSAYSQAVRKVESMLCN